MWKGVRWLFGALTVVASLQLKDVNLPPEHLPYFFNAFPSYAESCQNDADCPYKSMIGKKACWGYEQECEKNNSYHVRSVCPGDHRGWVKSKEAQYDTFYTQADFGYVMEQRNDLMVMCEATYPDDTSLECSKFLRFCRGRNLMINFTGLVGRGDNLRYKTDILGPGQIGGRCKYHRSRLLREAEHVSALQSWAPELRHFEPTARPPRAAALCDLVVDTPTYIMKLDATVNMYHHFCDFFNLYASLHANASHPAAWGRGARVLVWETYTYESAFAPAFRAFTDRRVWDLKEFRGKTVCFRNVVLPLLPRMIFGLYYNTPLIYGCEKSGLFHAFSKHILHSLDIKLHLRRDDKIRITLLSRGTTYRNILNEVEILEALSKVPQYSVRRVVFDRRVPFTEQLEVVRNTDVLLGVHGAGLTHMLFLPDWAAVFEVYNCEDPNCYSDLARLRGVRYVTWEDPTKLQAQDDGRGPDGGAHAKFTNYRFDVEEFLRLTGVCAQHVASRADRRAFVAASLRARDEL